MYVVVCQKRKAQKLSARMAKTNNTIDEEIKYKAVLYFLHAHTKSNDLKLDKFLIYINYRINVYEYKPSWCIVTL